MYQYIGNFKKGSMVTYGNKDYHVQDNGKGYLHIIVFENGVRKKIALKDVQIWFEYGSETDWIFNGWYRVYPDYETFRIFAINEKNAA